jgi:hypothetical protein
MAKFDIEKLIATHTNDGKVDYTKINEELEEQNRNIVVKESKKEVEKLKGEQLSTIIKEIGIDGESLDDVKLYIKTLGGSTDEVKEQMLQLEKEKKDLQAKYDQEVKTRTELEETQREFKQTELIKSLGITDEKQIKFIKWDLSQQVSEDKTFEDVFNEFKEANKDDTTQIFIKDEFGGGDSKGLDIKSAFEKRRALRTK